MNDRQTDTTPPTGAGMVGTSDDGAFRVSFRRDVPGSIAQVWAALTDPDQMSTWLPGSDIEPQVDGRVRFDFGAEGQASGTVTSALPLNSAGPGDTSEMADLVEPTESTAMLEHTWVWEGLPDSTVLWQFQSMGDDAQVVLTHSAVDPGAAVEFAVGWHLILDTLERYLSGPDGQVGSGNDGEASPEEIITFYANQLS